MRSPALDHEQTQALLRAYAALAAEYGAESPKAIEARNRLVEGNIGLVFAVWGRSFRRRILHDDALGIGTQGLVKAIERFDVTRGLRFSTYATWWIRAALGRTAANEGHLVRIPVHAQQRGKTSTCADAAAAARRTCSLDMQVGEDGRETFGDITSDPEALEAFKSIEGENEARAVRAALATLPQLERDLLTAQAEGATAREMMLRFDVSRERLGQALGQAAGRMRRALAA